MRRFFLFLFFPLSFLAAANFTWNKDEDNQTWNTAANWAENSVPNAAEDNVTFGDVITQARTVSVNGAFTIGQLNFDSGQAYTLNPSAGSLTFNNGASASVLHVMNTNGNGAHVSSVNTTIPAQGLTLTQDSSGALTCSGVLSGSGLTKAGTGTVVLSGTNTHSATTLSAGTIQIPTDRGLGATTATLALSGGTLETTAALTLHASRTITLTGTPTISTGTFAVTGAGNITGAGSLTKTGSGTLTLTGTNDYSGGTNYNAGTVSVATESELGSGNHTFNGGTLQITTTTSGAKQITLTGAGTLDPQSNTLTWTGKITGSGALTKISAGTLILSNATNDYSGGTTVSSGTLSVGADSHLGNTSGGLTIATATFTNTATFTSARAISLTGTATIEPGAATTLTLSGDISGSGSLTKTGTTELILTGSNSYTGGTTISAGTLTGTTSGLTGNISNAGALVFSQSTTGTYSGVLSGAGTLTKTGTGSVRMTGSSTGFTGATTISQGTLLVDGSLINSSLITVVGTLGGSGTVSNVTSTGGTISPGGSIGTLTVNGTFTLDGTSTVLNEISPTNSDRIVVTGAVTLDGAFVVSPESGFYGLNRSYTVLTNNALSIATTFSSVSSLDSNFSPSLTYSLSEVTLYVRILQPFLDFPFANSNEESVGNNIDAISAGGAILSDTDLTFAIDSLTGLSFAEINDALDTFHPAQFGAISELQSSMGAEILNVFQPKKELSCGCYEESRFWLTPFGAWIAQKDYGMQTGFHTETSGASLGLDVHASEDWVIGAGGAFQKSTLDWHRHRGTLNSWGAYGALYASWEPGAFQMTVTGIGGKGWYDGIRRISFPDFHRAAESSIVGVDFLGRFSMAYYFGSPACYFYPFTQVDFTYLHLDPFKEKGAESLNLRVNSYSNLTMRNEAGFGLRVIDKNYEETICIAPLVSLSWVMYVPLIRNDFTSTFINQTIPFKTKGWDETWSMISAHFGLKMNYHCFELSGEYVLESCVEHHPGLDSQRAHLQFAWNW